MITHVTGDLLASDEKFIAHGVNCLGLMGAGIAKAIAVKHPVVEKVYREECTERRLLPGGCLAVMDKAADRYVFNLATQNSPGRDATYWRVAMAFGNMFEHCVAWGIKRVGIPRIGCGIGGLDWEPVEFIINGLYQWVPNGPDIVVYTHPSEAHKVW